MKLGPIIKQVTTLPPRVGWNPRTTPLDERTDYAMILDEPLPCTWDVVWVGGKVSRIQAVESSIVPPDQVPLHARGSLLLEYIALKLDEEKP